MSDTNMIDREQTPLRWRAIPNGRSDFENACRTAAEPRETSSMISRSNGNQFHFDPASYLDDLSADVIGIERHVNKGPPGEASFLRS